MAGTGEFCLKGHAFFARTAPKSAVLAFLTVLLRVNPRDTQKLTTGNIFGAVQVGRRWGHAHGRKKQNHFFAGTGHEGQQARRRRREPDEPPMRYGTPNFSKTPVTLSVTSTGSFCMSGYSVHFTRQLFAQNQVCQFAAQFHFIGLRISRA